MLHTALGEALSDLLSQDDVIEIMVNSDGHVWVDTLSKGKYQTGIVLTDTQRITVIKLVASYYHLHIDSEQPELACEFPFAAARFQAWVYPVTSSPVFVLRKKALQVHTIEDYVANQWLSREYADLLIQAINQRCNILIAGGTGSGKTTFANALLHCLKNTSDRIIVLEDLPELQVSSDDAVCLRTSAHVSMRDLVKGALRMRPDRIVIGEVRDAAALDLLKAWNTGHPGGLCTLHANRAESVISRLEDLMLETVTHVPDRLVKEAVDVIVFMEKQGYRDYLISEALCFSDKAKKLFVSS